MYEIRVYYNRKSDYPFVWSMDRGDISTEKIFKDVRIFGCKISSEFDSKHDNVNEPRAWFNVRCTKITEFNDVLYLE